MKRGSKRFVLTTRYHPSKQSSLVLQLAKSLDLSRGDCEVMLGSFGAIGQAGRYPWSQPYNSFQLMVEFNNALGYVIDNNASNVIYMSQIKPRTETSIVQTEGNWHPLRNKTMRTMHVSLRAFDGYHSCSPLPLIPDAYTVVELIFRFDMILQPMFDEVLSLMPCVTLYTSLLERTKRSIRSSGEQSATTTTTNELKEQKKDSAKECIGVSECTGGEESTSCGQEPEPDVSEDPILEHEDKIAGGNGESGIGQEGDVLKSLDCIESLAAEESNPSAGNEVAKDKLSVEPVEGQARKRKDKNSKPNAVEKAKDKPSIELVKVQARKRKDKNSKPDVGEKSKDKPSIESVKVQAHKRKDKSSKPDAGEEKSKDKHSVEHKRKDKSSKPDAGEEKSKDKHSVEHKRKDKDSKPEEKPKKDRQVGESVSDNHSKRRDSLVDSGSHRDSHHKVVSVDGATKSDGATKQRPRPSRWDVKPEDKPKAPSKNASPPKVVIPVLTSGGNKIPNVDSKRDTQQTQSPKSVKRPLQEEPKLVRCDATVGREETLLSAHNSKQASSIDCEAPVHKRSKRVTEQVDGEGKENKTPSGTPKHSPIILKISTKSLKGEREAMLEKPASDGAATPGSERGTSDSEGESDTEGESDSGEEEEHEYSPKYVGTPPSELPPVYNPTVRKNTRPAKMGANRKLPFHSAEMGEEGNRAAAMLESIPRTPGKDLDWGGAVQDLD